MKSFPLTDAKILKYFQLEKRKEIAKLPNEPSRIEALLGIPGKKWRLERRKYHAGCTTHLGCKKVTV